MAQAHPSPENIQPYGDAHPAQPDDYHVDYDSIHGDEREHRSGRSLRGIVVAAGAVLLTLVGAGGTAVALSGQHGSGAKVEARGPHPGGGGKNAIAPSPSDSPAAASTPEASAAPTAAPQAEATPSPDTASNNPPTPQAPGAPDDAEAARFIGQGATKNKVDISVACPADGGKGPDGRTLGNMKLQFDPSQQPHLDRTKGEYDFGFYCVGNDGSYKPAPIVPAGSEGATGVVEVTSDDGILDPMDLGRQAASKTGFGDGAVVGFYVPDPSGKEVYVSLRDI